MARSGSHETQGLRTHPQLLRLGKRREGAEEPTLPAATPTLGTRRPQDQIKTLSKLSAFLILGDGAPYSWLTAIALALYMPQVRQILCARHVPLTFPAYSCRAMPQFLYADRRFAVRASFDDSGRSRDILNFAEFVRRTPVRSANIPRRSHRKVWKS